MKVKRTVAMFCLGAVLLATAWLIFSGSMIGTTLFPENQVLIKASEGAQMRVANGGLSVLSGSAGMTHYSPAMTLAIVVPFGVIVLIALLGCVLMFRNQPQPSSSG